MEGDAAKVNQLQILLPQMELWSVVDKGHDGVRPSGPSNFATLVTMVKQTT